MWTRARCVHEIYVRDPGIEATRGDTSGEFLMASTESVMIVRPDAMGTIRGDGVMMLSRGGSKSQNIQSFSRRM